MSSKRIDGNYFRILLTIWKIIFIPKRWQEEQRGETRKWKHKKDQFNHFLFKWVALEMTYNKSVTTRSLLTTLEVFFAVKLWLLLHFYFWYFKAFQRILILWRWPIWPAPHASVFSFQFNILSTTVTLFPVKKNFFLNRIQIEMIVKLS